MGVGFSGRGSTFGQPDRSGGPLLTDDDSFLAAIGTRRLLEATQPMEPQRAGRVARFERGRGQGYAQRPVLC